MKIQPLQQDSNFESIEIKNGTPHCKNHGAMNKVSVYEDGVSGIWRCICSVSKLNDNNCRTSCEQIKT